MKRFLLALLLLFTVQTPAYATLYRYSGNIPMAKMMLDFMEVMGFIYRVPESSAAGGRGYSPSAASLWGFPPGSLVPGPVINGQIQTPPVATARTMPGAKGLNGIWRDSNQNVLSIYGRRFVWTDKNGRAIHGEFSVQGDIMVTRIPEKNITMTYHIHQKGNDFTAVTDAGLKYHFVRQN